MILLLVVLVAAVSADVSHLHYLPPNQDAPSVTRNYIPPAHSPQQEQYQPAPQPEYHAPAPQPEYHAPAPAPQQEYHAPAPAAAASYDDENGYNYKVPNGSF